MGGMSIGIDFEDLGIEPDYTGPVEPADIPVPQGRNLVAGSTLAKTLFSVWDGAPIVIVDSPPGAGKTTLVVDIVAYLKERSDLKMIIACYTRRAAYDIAARIAAELGPDKDGNPQVALGIKDMEPPAGVGKGGAAAGGRNIPIVRTVASCKISPPECDLFIIDEAYQVTFNDASAAGDQADQLLMVGDPGQIGPVVSADVSAFRGREIAPHMRAPEVFATMEGAVVHALTTTYRVGQETVDAIAPLYNFSFDSARPDRFLTDADGDRVSEINSMEVDSPTSFDDLNLLVKIARYTAGLIGVDLVEYDSEGSAFRRELEPSDICVVVAHNAQASGITAILRTLKADGITVLTADKAQGGQWHAVVALDPCVGVSTAGTHQVSPGRLCVMASRHKSHLTWIYDNQWEDLLTDPELDQEEARLGRLVRYRLTAN